MGQTRSQSHLLGPPLDRDDPYRERMRKWTDRFPACLDREAGKPGKLRLVLTDAT